MRKAFLLCNDISMSPLNYGFRLSLSLIKVGGRAGSAYLAFGSFGLADQFPKPAGRLILEASKLPDDCSRDFSKTPLLLLETEKEIELLRANPEQFPYERHLFMFTANGHLVPASA